MTSVLENASIMNFPKLANRLNASFVDSGERRSQANHESGAARNVASFRKGLLRGSLHFKGFPSPDKREF